MCNGNKIRKEEKLGKRVGEGRALAGERGS